MSARPRGDCIAVHPEDSIRYGAANAVRCANDAGHSGQHEDTEGRRW